MAAVAAVGEAGKAATPPPEPLAWNTITNQVTAKPGAVSAHLTFWATNVSAAEVVIDGFKTSCGCTSAKVPGGIPWHLKPGESGPMEITVDLREEHGTVLKGIEVQSTNAPKQLIVLVTVPPPGTNALSREEATRRWNQEMAMADRQAVFKTDCVKCHLEPAFGKSGEPLYNVACGICHDAVKRAPFVPDLATLKVETGTNYWRDMIAHGKEGTLMPGSAAADGGPLDEPQIQSLVDLMMQRHPPPAKETNQVEKTK